MLEGSLLEPLDAHFYWNGTFAEAGRRALLTHPIGAFAASAVYGSAIPARERDEAISIAFCGWTNCVICPTTSSLNATVMSMAHSLEVRPPYLDHRVIEFAATLPENFKIRGNSS